MAKSAKRHPTGNGGDGDADNNGGPSDGDGNPAMPDRRQSIPRMRRGDGRMRVPPADRGFFLDFCLKSSDRIGQPGASGRLAGSLP